MKPYSVVVAVSIQIGRANKKTEQPTRSLSLTNFYSYLAVYNALIRTLTGGR